MMGQMTGGMMWGTGLIGLLVLALLIGGMGFPGRFRVCAIPRNRDIGAIAFFGFRRKHVASIHTHKIGVGVGLPHSAPRRPETVKLSRAENEP